MNTTQMTIDLDIASSLIAFMDEFPQADLNDCVDFVCASFNLSATDELIDEIADFIDNEVEETFDCDDDQALEDFSLECAFGPND